MEWKDTEEAQVRRNSQESLFNLTREFEVQVSVILRFFLMYQENSRFDGSYRQK